MTPDERPILARRTAEFGETIFSEMTALALEHGAVNLGQGFPDFAPPGFVLEAAAEAVAAGDHQYARSAGAPVLVEQIAADASEELGRTLDPMREVTVTVGATEGIFAAAHALIDPGDEVILFEPFYDSYPAVISLCGGVPRYIPLVPDQGGCWRFDEQDLRRTFSDRTKLIIVNTPHNPTGKAYTGEELELIADLCLEHDALVLCDEVYERILFDAPHRHLSTLPGMWERTVTLHSAGKTFSVTGWKIGWAISSPRLSDGIRKIHQWNPFAVATPLQAAVARILARAPEQAYYGWLAGMYARKRDRLVEVLRRAGLEPFVPEGTYFIIADTSPLGFDDDEQFCRYLTTEVGVAAIPPGAFYSTEHRHLAASHARFCFCKDDRTLDEAAARLSRMKQP